MDPDYLFVEPSSQVLTKELHDVTAMALRDVSYEIGPFVTLIDGPMFEYWWEERQPLLLGQVAGADLVAVSQVDRLGDGDFEGIRRQLEPHVQGYLLALASSRGEGVPRVVARIDASDSGGPE